MRSAPAVSTPARERPPLDGPISAELVGERPLRVSSTGRLARQVPAIAVLAAVRPQLGASPPRLRLHQVLDGEARRGLVLVPLLGSAHPAPPLVVHTSSVPCPRTRSAARRVGTECVSTGRFRW